jgi:hypothetical protein
MLAVPAPTRGLTARAAPAVRGRAGPRCRNGSAFAGPLVSATAVATGKASSPRTAEPTSDQTDVGGLKALLALLDVELDPLVLVQAAEPAR